ncbi:Nramp family divalent metal transporter [Streptococcus porcinus]|uniref:Mn2+/Fe2+ transporter n=2 Tax=Streptococcus porcinus TaxID=1340 RepID=A0A4V6LXT9_STRPO|nr:Nramp family divalent metal transporter [Streptococcus porcinus]EGJ26454.1 manganese transport protein MntH [Streptococcus porcinus str. Jelinkova 176]MBA2796189.1 Nramp family divalent metal transporter [Streptococcus porcinus]SQG42633.1 Mn2+/Fe2+ transporter [Streptococcus porcinus]VTT41659.1 Mn2+/Fe2+ transporter [Streptococcus porcinus]VTT42726.1 Mn2+/Fe2+ transporter [Streptococcus porcinus]
MNSQDHDKSPKNRFINYANGPSLQEINGTIDVPKGMSFFKTLLAYSGPGALVAVGYMDPGNWSTSITGGQNFQYLLISIILMSSLIAMLLQYMAAKLGIVSQMDLAQAIRARTSKQLGIVLWILTELAIMATDIAEVIGGAVALYLLFHIPLEIAVFITVFDVLLLLLLTKVGFRKIEALVVALILVIFFVFAYQVALSHPIWSDVIKGIVPSAEAFSTTHTVNGQTPLAGTLGIIGATVMPHNLYLHSSVVQSRKLDHHNKKDIARAIRFSTFDSNIQLTVAFFVNSLLLIMGVAVFKTGSVADPSFFGLFRALSNPSIMSNSILAHVASSGMLSLLFAVALLASGQNSTITGTLTGQIIMEGFIHMKVPTWVRRLVTRLISVIPVLICVFLTSGKSAIAEHIAINNLMNNSQVFLAFALPFSMLPLLIFTNSKIEMKDDFKNTFLVKVLGWISVIALIYLNMKGLPDQIEGFWGDHPSHHQIMVADSIAYVVMLSMILLLIWTIYELYKGNDKYHFSQRKASL